MPLAKYRTIDGERWRLYGIITTSGIADIPRAKKIASGIKQLAGKRVRREKNVIYTRF
jgi:hypothetical protein